MAFKVLKYGWGDIKKGWHKVLKKWRGIKEGGIRFLGGGIKGGWHKDMEKNGGWHKKSGVKKNHCTTHQPPTTTK